MRSIKVALPVFLLAPWLVFFALSAATEDRGVNSIWDLAMFGVLMWWLLALLILLPAVPRVLIMRRRKRWAPDEHEGVWRARQRTVMLDGAKMFIALVAVLGLLIWSEGLFDIKNPGEHDVSVMVPEGTGWVTAYVAKPRMRECPDKTTLVVRTDGQAARPTVTVRDDDVRSVGRSRYETRYRIPMTWDRTWTSCYYEFPGFETSGESVPVNLYVHGVSTPAGSVPEPTRAINGYWGWRCRAKSQETDCAVMAVLNSDPEASGIAVMLLIVGAVVAGILTLIGSVLLSLWRGWADDVSSVARVVLARKRR